MQVAGKTASVKISENWQRFPGREIFGSRVARASFKGDVGGPRQERSSGQGLAPRGNINSLPPRLALSKSMNPAGSALPRAYE